MKKNFLKKLTVLVAVIFALVCIGCDGNTDQENADAYRSSAALSHLLESEDSQNKEIETPALDQQSEAFSGGSSSGIIDLSSIPPYSGEPFTNINGGVPQFGAEELAQNTFEKYGPLDNLGRATMAFALVSDETRPKSGEKRQSISEIHPSGWRQAQYDSIQGGSLYNRSHLIAWSLSDENANPRNLITGTTYMNQETMQGFEQRILGHIRNTGNHVLLRVTPVYQGSELVARGVHYEAQSIEDGGRAISINAFLWNVQPGIAIDYATGESQIEVTDELTPTSSAPNAVADYILNTRSKKFHYPTCASVRDMKEKNKDYFTGSREDVMQQGYTPCGNCHP